MPRKCSVCMRTDRDLVDADLAADASFREIGMRFGLALATVHRHARHAQRAAVQALAEVPKADERVLGEVDPLVSEAERLLSKRNGEGHGPQPPKPELLSEVSRLAHVESPASEAERALANPDRSAPAVDAPDPLDHRSQAEARAEGNGAQRSASAANPFPPDHALHGAAERLAAKRRRMAEAERLRIATFGR